MSLGGSRPRLHRETLAGPGQLCNPTHCDDGIAGAILIAPDIGGIIGGSGAWGRFPVTSGRRLVVVANRKTVSYLYNCRPPPPVGQQSTEIDCVSGINLFPLLRDGGLCESHFFTVFANSHRSCFRKLLKSNKSENRRNYCMDITKNEAQTRPDRTFGATGERGSEMLKIKTITVGFYLGIAALGMAMVGAASPASAIPITTPAGLSPGDLYRLAFVTSATRDATSAHIADYNKFVTGVANAETTGTLMALGTTWTAIASTPTVDARDNTGTNKFTDGVGVPIYLLDGLTLIASSNADLWDDHLAAPLFFDENGALLPTFVWTGTEGRGKGIPNRELGSNALSTLGDSVDFDVDWIGFGDEPNDRNHNFYALSGILEVASEETVPEPSTWTLLLGGLASIAWFRRRRQSRNRN
jgi:hypothetical protein